MSKIVAFCGAGISAAKPLSLPTTYQFFEKIIQGYLHQEHPMTAHSKGPFKRVLAYLFRSSDIAKYDLELLYRYFEWVMKAEAEFLYPTAFLFQITAGGSFNSTPSPQDLNDDLNSRMPTVTGHYDIAREWIKGTQEDLRRSFNWEYLVRANRGVDAKDVYLPLVKLLKELSNPPNTIFTLNWDTSWEAISGNVQARKEVCDILGINTNDEIFLNGFRPQYGERIYDADEWSKAPQFPGIALIRLHGSILWRRSIETGDVYVSRLSSPEHPRPDSGLEQCLIYPGGKSEAVSTHPWDSLLAQFRNVLQEASVLLILGYSFRDKHINEDILNGMKNNRTLHLVSVNPDDTEKLIKADADAKNFFDNLDKGRLVPIKGFWPDTVGDIIEAILDII